MGTTDYPALTRYVADADRSYRQMRTLVIDRFAPGTDLDSCPLDSTQRQAVTDFAAAERALADYRYRIHSARPGTGR